MSAFEIEGGISLKGDIFPQGAKNEALQVICAVLLTGEEVIIENIPNIVDVNNLIDILKDLGVEVKKINKSSYSFKAEQIDLEYFSSKKYKEKGASIRGSIMLIGPML